jgi:inner membrane protein
VPQKRIMKLPSSITHFIVGTSLAWPFTTIRTTSDVLRPGGLIFAAGLLATIPDIDSSYFGIVTQSPFFGHRGFFHSPFVLVCLALLLSGLLCLLVRPLTPRSWPLLWLLFSLAAISHPLLDGLTPSGRGVMFLYPFSEQRMLLPWQPLHTLPISLKHLSLMGAKVGLFSELPLIIPCLVAAVMLRLGLASHWKSRPYARAHDPKTRNPSNF